MGPITNYEVGKMLHREYEAEASRYWGQDVPREAKHDLVKPHRSALALAGIVLAVLLLVITVMPALAWEDEDGPDFQPVRSCQVKVTGEGLSRMVCVKIPVHHHSRMISERPVGSFGVMRAEKFFLQSWQPAEPVVQAVQK